MSFLPLYHLGPREEDSYSDQPPLQAVRDLMTKAAYPPSDDPPRLPSFVFNARTQPTRVAWFGEAPVEPRSSRSGGNPYAVSYLDKPAATSSDHIALTIGGTLISHSQVAGLSHMALIFFTDLCCPLRVWFCSILNLAFFHSGHLTSANNFTHHAEDPRADMQRIL